MSGSMLKNARELRHNMTKEERHLWYDFLRSCPDHVYRQRVFGRYIADFYCAAAKLVIELDGSQHCEDRAIAYDRERTRYLESCGIAVLRIPNHEVIENFEGVCDYIDAVIQKRKRDLMK